MIYLQPTQNKAQDETPRASLRGSVWSFPAFVSGEARRRGCLYPSFHEHPNAHTSPASVSSGLKRQMFHAGGKTHTHTHTRV